MGDKKQSVLRTLIYSDIFATPLTVEEIFFYSIGDQLTIAEIKRIINNSKNIFSLSSGYVSLKNREATINSRKRNIPHTQQKFELAKVITEKLSSIPTILFIGVSGSLAAENAKKTDDIDFFIVTKNNTLFISRLCIAIFLTVLGVRRRRNAKNTANKICVNLLCDEKGLSNIVAQKNIYKARELVQVKSLLEKGEVYKRFIGKNIWIKEYFPTAFLQMKSDRKVKKTDENAFLYLVNLFFFIPQLIIMRLHGQKGIDLHHLSFYPNNREHFIVNRYIDRVNEGR